jgi:hypothetical protein
MYCLWEGERAMTTREEVGKWLVENHIPSISPASAAHLAGIYTDLNEAKQKLPDGDLKEILDIYSVALDTVMWVSAVHQLQVIKSFGELIGKEAEEE